MPKEMVEDSGPRMFDMHVGWDKDKGYAQLGLLKSPDNDGVLTINDNEYDGVWTTLNPENIKALIKLLRKAQRQALDNP